MRAIHATRRLVFGAVVCALGLAGLVAPQAHGASLRVTGVAIATANMDAPGHEPGKVAAMRALRSRARVIGWQEVAGLDPTGGAARWRIVRSGVNAVTWNRRYFALVRSRSVSAATFTAGYDCGAHAGAESAAAVVLRNRASGRRFVFVDAHTVPGAWTKAGPASHPEQRPCWWSQVRKLRTLANNLSGGRLPVVMVGDFNRPDEDGWTVKGFTNHIDPGHPTHARAYFDRIFTRAVVSESNTTRFSLGAASDHDALTGYVRYR